MSDDIHDDRPSREQATQRAIEADGHIVLERIPGLDLDVYVVRAFQVGERQGAIVLPANMTLAEREVAKVSLAVALTRLQAED